MSAAAALLGVSLVVAGCGSSSGSSPAASTPTTATTPAAAPNTISTATGTDGTYLVGPSGRALYLFDADGKGVSKCSGACASAWPPLIISGTPAVSGGVKAAELGTTTNGSHQVTYNGHPLYYFAGDSGPGTTTGQGSDDFGAEWWLVSTAGASVTTGSSAGASSGY